MARCPAHDDRSPSLSVNVGAGGAVLLKCFAGCDTASICASLGLSVRDLFPPRDLAELAKRERVDVERRRSFRAAPRAAVESFLGQEIERARLRRLERTPVDTPITRSSDVNAARARAAALFSIVLAPIAQYSWEGYEPHDRDPAWPRLFSEAILEQQMRFVDDARLAPLVDVTPAMRIRAEDRAAARLHELAARYAESDDLICRRSKN
jgi:hypothetical protein